MIPTYALGYLELIHQCGGGSRIPRIQNQEHIRAVTSSINGIFSVVLIQSQEICQRSEADPRDLRRGIADGHQRGGAFAGLVLAQLYFRALLKSDQVSAEGGQYTFGGLESQEVFLASRHQSFRRHRGGQSF